MRPSFLGALGWLVLVAALYASAFGWLGQRKLRDRWRGPDALEGELTESLACDLVTDFVGEHEHAQRVDCPGSLELSGDVARLADTRVDGARRSWCLARAPHWRVLRSTQGVPCFPTPPESAHPLEAEQERVLAWAQLELEKRLELIRGAMASEDRPRKCPVTEYGGAREVPLLEFELLQGPGSVRWSFLSTSWLRAAVVDATPTAALAAIDRWSELRPWVAVVTSSTREEPRQAGSGWVKGALQGSIALVDAQTGALRCEAPFAFDSGPGILLPDMVPRLGNTRRSPLIPRTLPEARVRADFEARYRAAASAVLNEMTTWDAWPASQ